MTAHRIPIAVRILAAALLICCGVASATQAGEQAISLKPARLLPGVYFARLTTDSGHTASARWTIVR